MRQVPEPEMSEIERSNHPETEEPEETAEPSFDDAADGPRTKQTSVAKSAGIVSIAVMFSRVLGLVREQVFAYYFGAGFLYDAYQAAFTIPNVLRDLFAEGALSAAFVKVFTDYQIKKGEQEAWRLASMVFNALAVVLSVFVIAGILLTPFLVSIVATGFSPEKAALTVTMTQIMFPFILLVALAAVAMGVLNTKGVFGVPASASTVFNIVSILFGLGFAYWLAGGSWETSGSKSIIPSGTAQWAIIGMSIGTLIGGGAQLLMQVPSLLKVGFRFSPVLSFTDEGVRRIMKLMAPAIIGTSAVQINVLVNLAIVSGIDGGRSWLSYAFRLMQFPIGVFGVAVGTASIPVLSRMASEGKFADFRDTLSSSMKLIFLMTVPSACGLVVLSEPIIRLLYLHGGAFKDSDVPMTAYALAGYSIGLTGYAAIKVLSPAFYALDDARTPMIIAVGSIIVNAGASFLFRDLLSVYNLGHVGVALATSSVALVNFFALALMMRRRIERINGRDIAASFVKIVIASALMSVVCWFSYKFLHGWLGGHGIISKSIECFVPIGLGGLVFVVAAKILRIDEIDKIYRAFARKLGRG